MAESITLARPYAKAAFESALEGGQLADWSEQLGLASALVSDRDMLAILKHPGLTSEKKAAILVDISEGKLAGGPDNFIRVLAENHRLLLLPHISMLFEMLKSQQEATVDVTVETAFKLNASQRTKLIETLRKKLDREINLQSAVNKKLIGGVLIRAGDLVIDATVRGRLEKLAEAIGS
jgi:F-type H+-transporting ATPase subunit delta